MRHARELASAGFYLCAIGLALGALAATSALALKTAPENPLLGWMSWLGATEADQETRLSRALPDAQDIKAALAKPVPPPAPLEPVTAKIALGHLRPGAHKVARVLRPSPAGLDAWAMQQLPPGVSAFATPDRHRVY